VYMLAVSSQTTHSSGSRFVYGNRSTRHNQSAVVPGRDSSGMCLHLTCLLQNSAQSNKSADGLAVMYRDVMTQLLDKHCPVVEVRRRVRSATPCFDAECHDVRRKVRAAEID